MRQFHGSNRQDNGERSARGRRTVVQACFQQNTGHWRASGGNAWIRRWSLQEAGLQHLGHPVHGVLRQTLPNLFRRGMFVQGLYWIGRRTLRRTVASSYAYGQRRHGEDDDNRAPSPAPTTLEIRQMQHLELRDLLISYHIVLHGRKQLGVTTVTAETRSRTTLDTQAVRLVAFVHMAETNSGLD